MTTKMFLTLLACAVASAVNSKFLKHDGSLIGFRTTDNLHPVEEGFEIWASAVAPMLKGWIK